MVTRRGLRWDSTERVWYDPETGATRWASGTVSEQRPRWVNSGEGWVRVGSELRGDR
jgi:hypothetical protein